MEITSLQNKKVKYWVSLQNKKVRDQEKVFIVEGDHLLKEAQKQNLVQEVISLDDAKADYLVTKEIMQKISRQKSISSCIGICRMKKEEEITGNVLILDCLQDPANLGSLIRSAVAFNFSTLILSLDTVDQYNEKAIRASEGMIFNVNILRRDLKEAISLLKEKGYTIVGTDVKSGQEIGDVPKEKIALVIGNEGQGMHPEIKALCDEMTHIPLNENCESLNAGVAGAILMYEVNHE